MGKGVTSLTLDTDLIEMARIRRIEDSNFNLSLMVNDFLRKYFGEEIKDLSKRKINARKIELKREMALLEAQSKAYESEMEKQKQEEIEKQFGKGAKETEFDPLTFKS